MRKYIVGVGLIVLAIVVLFQDSVWAIHLPLPLGVLIIAVGLAIATVAGFLRRRLSLPFLTGTLLFILLNHYYHFIGVNHWTIAFAAFLVLLGLKIILDPKKSTTLLMSSEKDVLFGSGTRYINDEYFSHDSVDVAFGSATIYFENAEIVEDRASFEIDAAFSEVILYVPRNWHVDLRVDNAFSGVTNRPSDFPADKTLRVDADLAFSSLRIEYV